MLKPSRLFALLAILAIGLLAGCGSDGDSGGDGGSSGASKTDDPAALLKKAFSTEVESGVLKMKADVDVKGSGKVSGPISFTLDGPFQSQGKKELPLLDWDITASGAGQNLSGGVVATKDNAFLSFRGQTYEVGEDLFEKFKSQQEQQSSSGPQSLEDLGVDPSKWLDDAKVTDGDDVDGDETREVSGDVNVARMVDDILKAADSPAIRKQLESTGRPIPDISDSEKKKVVDAIEKASFTVNIDDKNIARKVVFNLDFKAPEGADTDGVTGGTVAFEYELSKVGDKVDITEPSGAKPLSLLLQQFGLGAGMPGGLTTQ